MDAANTRPQLPALSYLDHEKVKREEDAYQNRNTLAPQTMPLTTLASPVQHGYPTGPPPPYSHAGQPPAQQQFTNSLPAVQSGRHTPPGAHRTSGENEKENLRQAVKQSLPSISEALGVDGHGSYSTPATVPAAPAVSAHQSLAPSAAPASPSPAVRRSYGMEAQQPQHTPYTTASYQHHSHYAPEAVQQQSYPPHDTPRAAYAPEPLAKSHLHQIQIRQSPAAQPSQHPSAHHYPPHRPSPTQEQPPPQSNGAMGPPASFPYGYTPYPQRYAQPTPPASTSSGPIYQPSVNFAAPPTPTSSWQSENSSNSSSFRSAADRPQYGDSVKRHLDLFDLENALNDVSQNSRIVVDFASRYSDRMHATARSGPSPSTLPGMVEVDDMVHKSRVQLDSLLKIRDVVLAQQAAYDAQASEARAAHNSQPQTSSKPVYPDPATLSAAPGVGFVANDDDANATATTNGFAGSDPKKRRGRAAPPGRCHSCNRAETPEWRRGPDGARTLCNACGLHYAKLTRKANQAGKSGSGGGANGVGAGGNGGGVLRPKEVGTGGQQQ